jgi:hypothetical protein
MYAELFSALSLSGSAYTGGGLIRARRIYEVGTVGIGVESQIKIFKKLLIRNI